MKTSSFLLKLAILLGVLQGNTDITPSVGTEGGRRQAPSFSPHTYPFTPFLGGLLLNCRVCLCLNLGGPLRGVIGPWLGAGGPRVVVSAILAVPGWLLCFPFRLSGEWKEMKTLGVRRTVSYHSFEHCELGLLCWRRQTRRNDFRKHDIKQWRYSGECNGLSIKRFWNKIYRFMMVGDIVQSVEHLPTTLKDLGSIPTTEKPELVV